VEWYFTKEKLQRCKRVKENISGYFAAAVFKWLTGTVHLVTVNDYLAKRDSTWKAFI
jgi:hypothetical protein